MTDKALLVSELQRFERNLENFANTTPDQALHHKFLGILESQITTLNLCGVITNAKAAKLLTRVAEATRRCRDQATETDSR